MADTLIFMKIEGVTGESTAAGFSAQIELESVDWSLKVQPYTSTSTTFADQLKFGKVTVRKFYDLSTGSLMALAKAQKRGKEDNKLAFKKAEIRYVDMVMASDGSKYNVPVVEFTLHECYIDKVDLSVGGSGKSLQMGESIIITFKKIDIVYHPAAADPIQRGRSMTFKAETADESGAADD